MSEWFKGAYLRGSKPDSKDTIVAVFASLAMHIGVVLILTTATAMSTGLKLLEDPVLHVSLVSMSTVNESRILPDTGKTENARLDNRNSVVEPAVVVVSIDKLERNKIQVEQVKPHVVGSQSVNFLATETTSLTRSGSIETTKAAQNDKGLQVPVISGASLLEPASIAMPRYRENIHPVYPWIARLRGYEGVVLLSAEIFTDGKVGSLKIKRSSGYALLDRSALEAVKTWKFEPARRMGRLIPMWVDVPVKFVLRDRDNEPTI
jgi:TonB family protein